MELLDTEVKIDLPRLMIKHMQRVLLKDGKVHALPYEFWFTPIFEDYSIPIQVWSLQTTQDVIGNVSMRGTDTSLQHAKNALVEKDVALIIAQAEYEAKRVMLQD